MRTQDHEVAGAIFMEISERFAFMFGRPVDEIVTLPADQKWSQADISFKGGVSGTITLTVPRELCAGLAANILGLEPEDLEYGPVAKDALCELLNVVSGHVVRGLMEETDVFDLSVPTYKEPDLAELSALVADDETVSYNLDGMPVMLGLKLT